MEEHIFGEYPHSGFRQEFAKIQTQIIELEMRKSANYNKELQGKLERAIALLRLHIQNYQRIVIFNRRRARQRLRRKQCTLRNIFLQSLMEMQTRFVETLPLAIQPSILLHTNVSKWDKKYSSQNSENDNSSNNLSFYNDIVSKFSSNQWLDTFHMTKKMFDSICTRLKTSLDNIEMDLENWLAMCIYTFASGSKFSSVAMLFNVEKKFVRQSLYKFSECLLNEFSEKMAMPNSRDEFETLSNGFYEVSNLMPCVVGVLNLFKIPNDCGCGAHNNCGSESIKVQVCIDNTLLFRKVETTCHKPTMFLRSPNEISVHNKKIAENYELPYFIAAPDNYPLRNWLMQRYSEPIEDWEYSFNKSCESLNIYREISLKRLFGRWHILDLNECVLPESKSFIVKACCLLHNLLEENQEEFSLDWCKNYNPSKYDCTLTQPVTQYFTDSKTAIEKRNLIAKYMFSTNVEKQ